MIGNEAYALIASTLGMSARGIPDGWTFIGTGAYRAAYMGPDGVVYKRQYDSDKHSDPYDCNRREAEFFYLHGDTTEGFRIAESTYYDCGVVAMEYVDGPPAHRSPLYTSEVRLAVEKWCRNLELWDVCGNNIRSDSRGEIIIVDYAT